MGIWDGARVEIWDRTHVEIWDRARVEILDRAFPAEILDQAAAQRCALVDA